MPKIYFKSKDVQNVDVLQWNGVCYTRTGNYGTASKNSNIPVTDIIKFYGDCDTCEGGQMTLASGTTSTVLSSTQSFQVLVPTLTSGQSTTLQFESDTTCDVVLSANASNQLVFDVNSSGSGPHVFTNVGDMINFETCDVPPLTYDVTYAGSGSYILNFKQTTPVLSADEGIDVENTFEDVDISELDEQELTELGDVISEAVAEEYQVDESQVETVFEEGSLRAMTRIRRLYRYVVSQIQEKDTSSMTAALTSMIASAPFIRPAVKNKMITNVTTQPPLRVAEASGDHNIDMVNHSTLCYKAIAGTDRGGKVNGRTTYGNTCNTRLYMKDNETLKISLKLDQGFKFDLFDSNNEPMRDTTEFYSVTGLPASGDSSVFVSLTPGFTGNIHYKDISGNMTGNPGPNRWNVPPGGQGTIYVKSTLPRVITPPPYHPEIKMYTRFPQGQLWGKSYDDVKKLADTISEAISSKMPVGSGDVKVYTTVTWMYPPQVLRNMVRIRGNMAYIGARAFTTIKFPENVTSGVYNLASDLIGDNGASSLSADLIDKIKDTQFDTPAMSAHFSGVVLTGWARETKPVIMCPQDVHECWDGTYRSRDPNDECKFPPCPPEPRWFTHVVGLSGRTPNHDAYIQLTGNKVNATSMYNTLSGFGDVPGHPSDYFVLKLRNEPTCYVVQLDPLKTGLVAEGDIPTGGVKLYRDYFKSPPSGYYRYGRTYFRMDYLLHKSLTACAPVNVPVLPDPTPTPTDQPVVNPPVVPDPTPTPTPTPTEPGSRTYNINFTPQGTTGYSLSPGDNTWLPSWTTDGLNGYVENISPTTMSPGVSSGWVKISFNDNVILTNPSHPSHPLGVKLLDLNGNVIWSQEGQRTLTIPMQTITNPNLYGAQSVEELINHFHGVLYFEYYCTAHPNTMKGRIYAYRDNA